MIDRLIDWLIQSINNNVRPAQRRLHRLLCRQSVFVFEPTQTFFVCLTNPHLDSDTHRRLSSLTCCSVWLMPSRYVRWESRVAAAMLEWMLRVFDFSPLRHDKTTTVSNNAAMETESEEYVTMARVSRSPSNCCLAKRERKRKKISAVMIVLKEMSQWNIMLLCRIVFLKNMENVNLFVKNSCLVVMWPWLSLCTIPLSVSCP